jgi:hypothetical protein
MSPHQTLKAAFAADSVRPALSRDIPSARPVLRTVPLGVMAVPFMWGCCYARTLASRLMAANTSIAIVHQIDFMDSSCILGELHVSCRIRELTVNYCFHTG